MIEEFRAIPRDLRCNISNRDLDGIIVLGEPDAIQHGGTFDFEGRDLIIIQTKPNRLGMGLMGQALFSKEIMKRFKPKSMKVIAICSRTDMELNKICATYNIEIVVITNESEDEGRSIRIEDHSTAEQ